MSYAQTSARTAKMRRRRAIDMVAALFMGAAIKPRPVFVKVPTVIPGCGEAADPESSDFLR
jgi:hypothetical protein